MRPYKTNFCIRFIAGCFLWIFSCLLFLSALEFLRSHKNEEETSHYSIPEEDHFEHPNGRRYDCVHGKDVARGWRWVCRSSTCKGDLFGGYQPDGRINTLSLTDL